MKRIIILLVGIILISCKDHLFYSELYSRADRNSRFYAKHYTQQERYCIPKFRSCHVTILRNALAMSSGNIFFNRDSIDYKVRSSYTRYFNIIGKPPPKLTFFDSKCDTPKKLFSDNLASYRSATGEICENIILPTLTITSNSGKYIEGSSMVIAEDMGVDIHLLEYKLITTIFQNDSLIYMDNRTHWTEILSERDEQVKYQVPQVILDSLVTLSLQEYFKRME